MGEPGRSNIPVKSKVGVDYRLLDNFELGGRASLYSSALGMARQGTVFVVLARRLPIKRLK
jgi:hypothetical protein